MTEVEGPPVPVLPFSSLLIRGPETAIVAGTDKQALEVNSSMAQAFEIPTRNRTAHQDPLRQPKAGHRQVSSNAFQIAAPVRSSGGSASGIWVRFRTAASASMPLCRSP